MIKKYHSCCCRKTKRQPCLTALQQWWETMAFIIPMHTKPPLLLLEKKKQQCCSGDSARATCLLGFWEMGQPRWVVTSCRTNRIPSSGSSKSYKVTHYIVWFQKCQYCKVNQTIERKQWDYNSQISNTSLISAYGYKTFSLTNMHLG